MNAGRFAVGLVILVGIALIVLYLRTPSDEIPVEELRQRVQESDPIWANYHEDLKAQIGSTPVARWVGEPVGARIVGSEVHVDFRLTGLWSELEFPLPMLVRNHLGTVVRESSAAQGNSAQGNSVMTYIFPLSDGVSPWVDLQYPHYTRKIVFNADGVWSGATD